MHIKQVIIEGFKSYKEQTALDPFNSKLNVVVGANGSGKSNFFSAIRFVVSDVQTQLNAESRQKLLHEGAGQAVHQAYVEVVFDNTDRRLPVERDEVRLRRMVSAKGDDYSLDRRAITKEEVGKVLESAGFSRSNPYYVVQQGKIMQMSMMKEGERLSLLKEIGGTRVYEERRAESLRIIRDTEGQRRQVEEVIEDLNMRLHDLDREKEELHRFQQLDRQRRGVEYMIYERELAGIRAEVESLERARERAAGEASAVLDRAGDARRTLADAEASLSKLRAERASVAKEQAEVSREKQTEMQRMAEAEMDLQEQRERAAAGEEQHGALRAELEGVEKRIEEQQRRVLDLTAAAAKEEAAEREASRALAEATRRVNALYQKQGRRRQFTSKAERDAYVQEEASRLETTLAQKREGLRQAQEQREALRREAARHAEEARRLQERLRHMGADTRGALDRQAELEAERNRLSDEQRALFRQQEEVARKLAEAGDRVSALNDRVQRSVPRAISEGLASVKRLVHEHNVAGVHGTLMELFHCPDKVATAVEVTAANQLTQVVVDDDEVATKLVRLLSQTQGGRVTFMPLSKLRAPEVPFPTNYGDAVVPLLNTLSFDDRFRPAMAQVFGRTAVCRTIDIATQVARETRLDCVTLDGDQVRKTGAMAGGYLDKTASRLLAMKAIRQAQEDQRELSRQRDECAAREVAVGEALARVTGELERLKVQGRRGEGTAEELRRDLEDAELARVEVERQASEQERAIRETEDAVAQLEGSLADMRSEIGAELTSKLSAEEQRELAELQVSQRSLTEQVAAAKARLIEARSTLEAAAVEIEGHLTKRRGELTASLSATDPERARREVARCERALEAAREAAREVGRREAAAAARAAEAEAAEGRARAEAEEAQRCIDEAEAAAREGRHAVERAVQKRSQLLARREDITRKVRDLGALPAEALQKYQGHDAAQLQRVLADTNKKLAKFAHVNQKALHQYTKFSEQRDELRKRLEELRTGEAKVRELIDTLDLRKNEAIERTFKQVAKNFGEIFAELVPGGRGQLVMIKSAKGSTGDADGADGEGEDGARPEGFDKYSGVKVKVSFGMGETLLMKQLSGGQKTLVSLALIFSIQRCDPAPFYLFDEIDAALDPQYRSAVAAMIRKQANNPASPSQFIITTFHPQLVSAADHVYGVAHASRISTVALVTKADALSFLDQNEQADGTQAPDAEVPEEIGGVEGDDVDEEAVVPRAGKKRGGKRGRD